MSDKECRGVGHCECFHCNEVRADERAKIVAWLRNISQGPSLVAAHVRALSNGIENKEYLKCAECAGRGDVPGGDLGAPIPCLACKGTGSDCSRFPIQGCDQCDGSGVTVASEV